MDLEFGESVWIYLVMDFAGLFEGHCQDLIQHNVDQSLFHGNPAGRYVAQGCNAELALPWLIVLSTNLRD